MLESLLATAVLARALRDARRLPPRKRVAEVEVAFRDRVTAWRYGVRDAVMFLLAPGRILDRAVWVDLLKVDEDIFHQQVLEALEKGGDRNVRT